MKLISRLRTRYFLYNSRRVSNRLSSSKTRLFSHLRGRVVEIGPGAGVNIPYLSKDVTYIGIEPNGHWREYFREEWKDTFPRIACIEGSAEQLPLEHDSADAIICTFVLCSVRDPQAALEEIRRVLKPGGEFVFIEHIGARSGSIHRLVQNICTPVSRRLCGGCEWNRETLKTIGRAGFSQVITPREYIIHGQIPRFVGPITFGRAIK